jgi:Ca-activated chloride channel family protein
MAVVVVGGLISCEAMYDPVGLQVREGLEHYESGRYDEALAAFRDAQIDAPNDRQIAMNIGSALFAIGQYDEAEEAFTEALGTSQSALRSQASYNLGNTRFQQQQLAQAAESYERALEIDPDDMDAKYNLEIVQLLLNQAASESGEQRQEQRRVSEWAKQRAREAEGLARQRRYADAFRLMRRTVETEQSAAEEYSDFIERLSDLALIFEGGS